MNSIRKIINDPVYGFITIDHPLILEIISHPVYQRLRNIHQMAFAHLVYPGQFIPVCIIRWVLII
jgi:HD superfamily phosphohydrolase